MRMVRLSVRVPSPERARLAKLAELGGNTESDVVRRALEIGLGRLVASPELLQGEVWA